MLPVAEVFETIQGEATNTGSPALFIRLQGCAVGCPWCDTRYTWATDPKDVVPLAEVLAKPDKANSPAFAWVKQGELALLAASYRARLVVITGGEPCNYDLAEFCLLLEGSGKDVQIETSGTREIKASPRAWVTLSPKIGMPGGFAVREDAVERADEIKMPAGSPRDIEKLQAFLAEHRHPAPPGGIWLQPLSRSPKATALCIEAATAHGWKLSVQTHAFIGVR